MTPSPQILTGAIAVAAARTAQVAYAGLSRLDNASGRHRAEIMDAITSSVSDGVSEALIEAGLHDADYVAQCQAAALAVFGAELERLRRADGGRA